ncbi:hypothetical protein M0805_000175 [Coniferiporia weirii]|nr:hypothetical protein M0805_000175 [Coniferiporia weirii]
MEQELFTYKPNDQVSQKRRELSKAFSALRSVRPRVPFWQLAVHRIPTLWFLYRGLLREAPGDNIRWRMRIFFEKYQSLTSPKTTQTKLAVAHRFLDAFRLAREGDQKMQRILARYNSLVGAKRDKEKFKDMLRREMAWQERLRNRPILTGAYLRPTLFNGPLPRMKPQPEHISMMIYHRRKRRERHGEIYTRLSELKGDIQQERNFEEALRDAASKSREGGFDPVFDDVGAWSEFFLSPYMFIVLTQKEAEHIESQQSEIRTTFNRDAARAVTPYSAEMLSAIREARLEKPRNKTRERERERRGEVLPRIIRRKRQEPPAHILAKMPDWRRHADKVARGISEVGYVAMMKRRLGRGMKNAHQWKELEHGRKEDQPRLDAIYAEIQEENKRRRIASGGGDN